MGLSFLVHGNWMFFSSKSHSYSHRVLPPFQPKKNLNKNDDINLRKPTQLTAVPCLWIRSLKEPTKVLDLEIAHLNEDRSDLRGKHPWKKNPWWQLPKGRKVPFFWSTDVCFYDLTPKGGFFWRFQGFPGRLKIHKFLVVDGFVCVGVTSETQPQKICGPGHLCAFAG